MVAKRRIDSRIARRLSLLLLVGSLACSGVGPPSSDTAGSRTEGQAEGHRRMIRLLEEMADRSPSDNPYLGDKLNRDLLAQLERLPASGETPERIRLLHALGMQELRLGRTDVAIDRLTRAHELAAGLGDPTANSVRIAVAYSLGVAHMRRAETLNCVTRHTSESCLLPIRGGGVHLDPSGSRKAIEYLTQVLELAPTKAMERVAAQWLMNIAYMTLGAYPDGVPAQYLIDPATFASDQAFPRFVNVAPELGLDAFDLCGGAVIEDFDLDGDLDILSSTWDPRGPMRYFRNDGPGGFEEIGAQAGLSGLAGGLNMVHTDYDNDGDADVLVLRGAWVAGPGGKQPNSLLRNDGAGRFQDVTFEAGLGEQHYPTQTAAWADYDNDGDLDLYIGNESNSRELAPGQLFRNDGNGRFHDVAAEAGVLNGGYAKAVTWGDYDNDRFPDLYVSNLRGANRLYHNNGDGTFSDLAARLDVTGPTDSFPAWFWDYDNDGFLDLFVSSYDQQTGPAKLFAVAASYTGLGTFAELPKLYRGGAGGGFRDVTREAHLDRVTMPMGSNFGDLDNDGYLDFYLGTGYPSYDGLMPNVMYRNVAGRHFADVTTAGGFGHLQKGHGVAFADIDDDGDQDVFEQMGGAFPGDAFGNVLYRNPGTGNHWIKIELVGVRSNRPGVGARIRAEFVDAGVRRSVYRHVNSSGSFGSNPLTQHIGLGKSDRVELLEIYWPTSDLTQRFTGIGVDQTLRITEGQPGQLDIKRKSSLISRLP